MAQVDHEVYDYMMGEENEEADFDDEAEEILLAARQKAAMKSDSDEDEVADVSDTSAADTTAVEARRGKDIQGIQWNILQFTRHKYREQRLQHYKNYENLNLSREELDQECKSVEKGENFYEFRFNSRSVKPSYVHFQLRNLVWATSKHDVYSMQNYSGMHWSALTRQRTEVLNVAGPVAPATQTRGNPSSNHQQGLGPIQISTMCIKRNLFVAGGFQGEMVCKNLNRTGVDYCAKITHDENAITNAIEIYDTICGGTRLMSSNNDSVVRIFDCERFSVLSKFVHKWPVNHTSVSPDGRLVVVVGDDVNGLLTDIRSEKVVETLRGHLDYSFASAWHPNGYVFATGNQDSTCRLWDARKLSSSFAILKGHIGAIRSIRFSSDGRFMAMAEPADFVHIFDTQQDFNRCQEIDLFGEIAGMSFSPDTEALFIGVADRTYGSLLEFNRCHASKYHDSCLY